jgi:hypothetical protein
MFYAWELIHSWLSDCFIFGPCNSEAKKKKKKVHTHIFIQVVPDNLEEEAYVRPKDSLQLISTEISHFHDLW